MPNENPNAPILTPAPKGLADELTIVVDPPIKGPADDVSRVVLREPTAGQMRDIKAKPLVDREIAGVSLVGGMPTTVVEQMPASKLYEADAWIWAWADEEGLPDDGLPAELVIPLGKPVTAGDVRYTELRLKEPTGAQVRKIRSEDPVSQQIAAVAVVSGLPEPAVAQIGVRAVTRAERYIVGFIEAGRRRVGGR